MKFVIDMNLSPEWKSPLLAANHEAVHWSEIGASNAPDVVLLEWAGTNRAVVNTMDVGISAMLALTSATGPSVVILRINHPNPSAHGSRLVTGLRAFESELLRGALVTLDESGRRVHLLPIGRQDHN